MDWQKVHSQSRKVWIGSNNLFVTFWTTLISFSYQVWFQILMSRFLTQECKNIEMFWEGGGYIEKLCKKGKGSKSLLIFWISPKEVLSTNSGHPPKSKRWHYEFDSRPFHPQHLISPKSTSKIIWFSIKQTISTCDVVELKFKFHFHQINVFIDRRHPDVYTLWKILF